MIIIFGYSDKEKVTLLKDFFERIKKEACFVDEGALSQTLASLLKGEGNFDYKPSKEKAILVSGENREEVAGKVLSALSKGQIGFDYHILVEEEMLEKNLEDIFSEHRAHRAFIKRLAYLQQLIDGTASLKEKDYDPDDWSELKLAVANANDYLDTLVNDYEETSKLAIQDGAGLEKLVNDLRLAMKNLLERKH